MRPSRCPKCKASLPRRGQFCLECGLDLYAEGLHRQPIPWFRILAIPVVVAAVVAVVVIGPCKSEVPPETELVTAQTKELLHLLAEKKYDEVVARFYVPNSARFARAEETLRDMIRGEGSGGFKNAQSQAFRDLDEAAAYVRKHITAHPEYVSRLLYAMVSQPEPWLLSARTETFFAWYLELAFEGVDVAGAQLAPEGPRWEEGVLVVNVRYPQPPEPLHGMPDPQVLRWRLAGGRGGCARQRALLEFGTEDHLAEVLDLFKRLPAE